MCNLIVLKRSNYVTLYVIAETSC